MCADGESDTFCAVDESSLSTMEYGSLLGSLAFLMLAVYSKEIQPIVFRALHELYIHLQTNWELVKRPRTLREMRPRKISISAATEADSVLSDMTRSTRNRSTSSSSNAETGGAKSEDTGFVEKREHSIHEMSHNEAQGTVIARDSNAKQPMRRPSVDSFHSDVDESDVASFAESSSVCKGPGHDSMTLGAENRSTDGFLPSNDTKHDSHDSMTLGFENRSTGGVLSWNDTRHDSMTLGAENMSTERVLPCDGIEHESPLSKPCSEVGKRKSDSVGQSVAAQIAQNVKRKLKLRHPVIRQTSSNSSLAQNSHGLRSSMHRGSVHWAQSCSAQVSRVPSGNSFGSANIVEGKENIPRQHTTPQRRASIGRSSDHRVPPRRHSTDDFFSSETSVDRDVKPPVRRRLLRSSSEAIMRSSAHRAKTRLSRVTNKTIGLNTASQHQISIERRGHSNTRSFLRSGSDVISVESTSKQPPPRHRAMALHRSESLRRIRSKVSNDRLPMRGCLRSHSSQSSRDLPSRVLPSRASSISSEDLQILRKVESSRNLFGF